MPNYENETCEGCRDFTLVTNKGEEFYRCMKHGKGTTSGFPLRPAWRCDDPDDFAPSLECRKVRAIEKQAACHAHVAAGMSMISAALLARLAGKSPATEAEFDEFMSRINEDLAETVSEIMEAE